MIVSENTPDRLVLRYWPVVETFVAGGAGAMFFWTIATADATSIWRLLSLVVLALLALFFGLFATTATCVFDRAAGRVTLITGTMVSRSTAEVALNDITGASVEENPDHDGNTTRPVLILTDRIVPLRPNFISSTAAARTVAVVDAWLASTPTA